MQGGEGRGGEGWGEGWGGVRGEGCMGCNGEKGEGEKGRREKGRREHSFGVAQCCCTMLLQNVAAWGGVGFQSDHRTLPQKSRKTTKN